MNDRTHSPGKKLRIFSLFREERKRKKERTPFYNINSTLYYNEKRKSKGFFAWITVRRIVLFAFGPKKGNKNELFSKSCSLQNQQGQKNPAAKDKHPRIKVFFSGWRKLNFAPFFPRLFHVPINVGKTLKNAAFKRNRRYFINLEAFWKDD